MTEYFTNDFSKEIWETKYKFTTDNTIEDTWLRVAKDLASIEDDQDKWTKKFYSILKNFHFMPGGRITANAGTNRSGLSYINCFTDAFEGEDQDSIEGIYSTLTRQAQILKSEGGYGFCADVMRPRGAHIGGIGNQSPGAVKFLELWDKSSEIITSGSGKENRKDEKQSIRKGAQLVSMSIWHPDIIEFVKAKTEPGRLTKFNMSVLCTDEFMRAVEDNQPWHLIFPDYENCTQEYTKYWNGDIKKWIANQRPVKIYQTLPAIELWEIIMKQTYERNDPGILQYDTINRMNNLWYIENICCSNPCIAQGELVNTPNGYRRVETINEGDYICTILGKEKVERVQISEHVPLFKIEFSDGGHQIVSATHRYHTCLQNSISKEIRILPACELQPGNKVRVYYSSFDDIEFNKDKYNHGLKTGILLGDGCYTKKQYKKTIKIASSQKDITYNSNVKTLFGNNNFNKDDLSTNSLSMSLCLKNGSIELNYYNLEPSYSYEKQIDMSVVTNISIAIGLLDGLLSTDGNVNLKSNHPQIRWATSSLKLAHNIRQILFYLGCHGIITKKSIVNGGSINGRIIRANHPGYTVNISGESFRQYSHFTHIKLIHPLKGKKIQYACINYRLSGNLWYAKIKSITSYEYGKVYDLYCNTSDTWISNGYVSQGCGEQPLDRSTCLLGSLNLIHYIDIEKKDWDYKKLKHDIKIAVRLMDNVNDISQVPLQVHKDSLKNKRRIGLGVIGYASALMMCRVKYGSKQALELTQKLMEFKANTEYQASVTLAKEKGIFPLFNKDKFLQSNFIKQLSQQTQQLIKKYGIRNSHLSSIQPTGNSSVYANNISSGLEPIFAQGYFRTVIVHHFPDGLCKPNVDWDKKAWTIKSSSTGVEFTVMGDAKVFWNWAKEGDEDILIAELNNITYKFDRNRGLTKEVLVEDYSISWLKKQNLWNEKASWAATANELKLKDHVETMKIFCKWIDAAASKTLNFSNDYPYEDFKQVYMEAWKAGIKGFTTYRAGTMTNVLSIESSNKTLERPKIVAADIHHHTVKGLPYIVFVGLVDNKPYEVFANASLNGDIDRKIKSGEIIKVRKNRYKAIIGQDEICPINALNDENEDALVRMISTNLQSNCDLNVLIKRLDKTQGSMVSLIKAISRALKKYIPDGSKEEGVCPECGSNSLIRESGCLICVCGYSACS